MRNKQVRPGLLPCYRTNPRYLVKLIDGVESPMSLAPPYDRPGRLFTNPGHHNIFYPGTLVQIDTVVKRRTGLAVKLAEATRQTSQLKQVDQKSKISGLRNHANYC